MHTDTQESKYRSGWLQGATYFTSVTEMASGMKEFFGPRVIKANYNAKGKQGHVPLEVGSTNS